MSVTFGSVCSGIEAASVAWLPLGMRALWHSEIERFPAAVLAHHYPEIPNYGDFTRLIKDRPANVDVLVGGTPCQAFSVAGLRGGLADPRGNLALAFVALVDALRPRWVVWENVPGVLSSGGGRDFGSFLGALGELGYGWAYRIMDAQYFGLAQRRQRVFVVASPGDWRGPAAVLFEPESVRRDSPPRRGSGAGVAGALGTGASRDGGWRVGADEAAAGQVVPTGDGMEWDQNVYPMKEPCSKGVAGAMRNSTHGHPDDPMFTLGASFEHGVAHTLAIHDASEDGTGRGVPLVPVVPVVPVGGYGVRRLMPHELERLQGFPDGYTAIPWRGKGVDECPDGLRAKALGNSMAVPVMRWIGARILIVDAIRTRATA